MRISNWSSDVCSSDLHYFSYFADRDTRSKLRNHHKPHAFHLEYRIQPRGRFGGSVNRQQRDDKARVQIAEQVRLTIEHKGTATLLAVHIEFRHQNWRRSEEHTSELQSLMRNSYAVFCLNKKKIRNQY